MLAIGPWEEREFATVRRQVDPSRQWTYIETIGEAQQLLSRHEASPEVALVAQPCPEYFTGDAVNRLLDQWPLMRIVVVAGSWCEGELRTGNPPSGAHRLYWHELPAWWRRCLAAVAAGRTPAWSQPIGSSTFRSTDSKAGAHVEMRQSVASDELLVHLFAPSFESYNAVRSALQVDGVTCRRFQPTVGANQLQLAAGDNYRYVAGVWDGRSLDAADARGLSEFAAAFSRPTAPVVALVDAPRVQDVQYVTELGAATLLGKPYSVAALCDEVRRVAIEFGAID